jgi:serine protease Do
MARWPLALALLTAGALLGAVVTTTQLKGQAPVTTTPIPKDLTSYREIVKRVLPAVVSVESKARQTAQANRRNQPRRVPQMDLPPGLPEEFRRFFEEMPQTESPDDMPRGHSFGSGFIVDPKGVIVTNFHVVAGTDQVEITLQDGRTFTSTDIHSDRKNDLAIVRIKTSSPLPYLEMGDSEAMEIGDRVLAVGAPFGLTGSVTSGIVSAKGRSGLNESRSVYEDYLQTDAAINPGNSGGPLINLSGQVIGINTAIKSRSGGFQGVGLAIASNVAKDVVDQLIKTGSVHRGYLGVGIEPLKPDVAEQLGLKNQSGLLVSKVYSGSPAGKAGLKAGDVIVDIAGKPVKDARSLQLMVSHLPLHKPVDLTVIHEDGKSAVMPVTIEEQPDAFGSAVARANRPGRAEGSEEEEMGVEKIGIQLSDLTPQLAKRYGYDDDAKGVVVTKVERDSLAYDSRLIPGTLILQINRKSVTSAAAVRDTLQKANLERGVFMKVQYPESVGGNVEYIMLRSATPSK